MKDIPGYKGLYAATSCGRIWSHTHKKFLKQKINSSGYRAVQLCKNGKVKELLVHRLIAMTYLTNDLNLPEINHKDENKLNNALNNLEWCTKSYNINYGNRNKVAGSKIAVALLGNHNRIKNKKPRA